MLNKQGIMDRYKEIRKCTAGFSGEVIIEIEGYIKGIAASHVEALAKIEELEKEVAQLKDYIHKMRMENEKLHKQTADKVLNVIGSYGDAMPCQNRIRTLFRM